MTEVALTDAENRERDTLVMSFIFQEIQPFFHISTLQKLPAKLVSEKVIEIFVF